MFCVSCLYHINFTESSKFTYMYPPRFKNMNNTQKDDLEIVNIGQDDNSKKLKELFDEANTERVEKEVIETKIGENICNLEGIPGVIPVRDMNKDHVKKILSIYMDYSKPEIVLKKVQLEGNGQFRLFYENAI